MNKTGCDKIIEIVNQIEIKWLYKSECSRAQGNSKGKTNPFLLTQFLYEGTWYL